MKDLLPLLRQNAEWAEETRQAQPDFFANLAALQNPEYLWIGCSDSRVPANQILGLRPGEVFVHRNVANIVGHTDLNCLSVVQYAIEVLEVKHIMIVGHYGCGGVRAALDGKSLGLIDNWLRHIQDVRDHHEAMLAALPDQDARWRRLCELNVIEQVRNLARTTIVSDAWRRQQDVTLHGWVYGLDNGLLNDLHMTVSCESPLDQAYQDALASLDPPRPDPLAR